MKVPVRHFSSNTISNHLSSWKHWPAWCKGLVHPARPNRDEVANYVLDERQGNLEDRSSRKGSALSRLSAIRWVAKHSGSEVLLEAASSDWVQALASGEGMDGDRKEALVFALGSVTSIEKRVC